ncbi:protein limb expression 1-like protein [Platysternon megacephalum]|uniref:Protein limb expression 1-like protein n=1 Tax=Platysternon megacephalum TaxID=55544 RepID=A0A4D9F4V4_9SAUR|nr:protein limb expression 1-like protein [Platysternon megacephalum]
MNYLYQQLLQREQSQSRNALYDYSGDLWMSYGQEDELKDRHKHQPRMPLLTDALKRPLSQPQAWPNLAMALLGHFFYFYNSRTGILSLNKTMHRLPQFVKTGQGNWPKANRRSLFPDMIMHLCYSS